MNSIAKETNPNAKILVRTCHVCGHIHSATEELKRCEGCAKSFLPLNYFSKVHAKNSTEFESLFLASHLIHEEDLVKGLFVLW